MYLVWDHPHKWSLYQEAIESGSSSSCVSGRPTQALLCITRQCTLRWNLYWNLINFFENDFAFFVNLVKQNFLSPIWLVWRYMLHVNKNSKEYFEEDSHPMCEACLFSKCLCLCLLLLLLLIFVFDYTVVSFLKYRLRMFSAQIIKKLKWKKEWMN